jgi:hypothetical protein
MTSVLSSTLLLTFLLLVGLFFFIRASVKDRTQVIKLVSEQSAELTLQQLKQYFIQRAYCLEATDSVQEQMVLEGMVRPSWFLAVFLTVMAAIGIGCLALVLSIIVPGLTPVLLGFMALAPLAGVFYWRGATRLEKVLLKVEPVSDASTNSGSLVTMTAHRDELLELQRHFSFKPIE